MIWTDSILSSELVFNRDESQDISVGKNSAFSKWYWYTQHRNNGTGTHNTETVLVHATYKGREMDPVLVGLVGSHKTP